MPFPIGRLPGFLTLSFAVLVVALAPAIASEDRVFTAAEIEAAEYAGGGLPSGRSPLTAKVQLLLDRSGISPGVIDGFKGGMSRSAIMAFERRAGLPVDGEMDPHVWNLLQAYAERPVTQSYTITEADAQGLVASIPTDYAEKALMESMGYTSVAERLAERFHMDERFIQMLNPGIAFVPGNTISVMAPNPPIRGQATRILIDKENRRVAAFNAAGEMLVDYPATIGSAATPSPTGTHNIRNVAINPNYTYNPSVNFQQGNNDRKLVIPPGPNGPVGTVWIGLTKPTYGIHGTPTPSQLFHNQSMGCVRLTNWDAEELARLVSINGTTVEFLPAGVSIADAIGAVPAQTPPTEPLNLPADAQPTQDITQPDAPSTTAPGEPGDAPADALSDALAEVLPEGFVIPLPETETAQP
ncbi:MAG: L,D-transpeptidase [Paracoccus sp. (in: a-proteobacteria)]|nr:L,D-transpeptidase [Paracoccus sp. (in: a-proteobacteria)]